MTAFTSRTLARHASLLDLAAIWVTLTATFAYLEVPLVNAPLFATALVLQAALGTVVITRLLKDTQPSLLMLLGPGLILGGALSFAVFQLTGRGVLGLGIAGATAVIATALLTRPESEPAATVPRLEVVVQLLGLSALGLASEFEWLLIPSLGCLLGGLLLALSHRRAASSRTAAIVILLGSSALATMFRGSWWWVVTDDYNFFEVLSRHLTKSGPLAEWGVLDVSRYHWLSYGWSGLLDYSAGSPEPLVTLTRVMPLVYALALAASLLLLGQTFVPRAKSVLIVAVPGWVLLANFKLDWAGTSTAGVYALLTTVVALLTILSMRQDAIWKRILVYATCAVLLSLTKIPSVLTVPALVLAVESNRISRNLNISRSASVGIASVLAGGALAFALLLPFSAYVEPLDFEWIGGGTASVDGTWLRELVGVGTRNAWIAAATLATWLVVTRLREVSLVRGPTLTTLSLAALWPVAILMNLSIQGTEKANFHEYFSGPNYFLAALAMSCLMTAYSPSAKVNSARLGLRWTTSWVLLALGIGVLARVTSLLQLPSFLDRATFRDFLTDERILISLPLIAWLTMRRNAESIRLRGAVLVVALAFFVFGIRETSEPLYHKGIRPSTSTSELEIMLGPDESRDVGVWLREHTDADVLIATNHLFVDAEQTVLGDDYSLAVWSKREFLVLGPKFFGVSETATREIQLCKRFASSPSAADAQLLGELGVSWFVVDRASTSEQSWEPYGEVVFRAGRFWVIKLASASA